MLEISFTFLYKPMNSEISKSSISDRKRVQCFDTDFYQYYQSTYAWSTVLSEKIGSTKVHFLA